MPAAANPEAITRQIGRRIAELRLQRGLTQRQLAAKMAVSIPWLSRVETSGVNMTIVTLTKIANALEVAPSALWEAPEAVKSPARGRPKKD